MSGDIHTSLHTRRWRFLPAGMLVLLLLGSTAAPVSGAEASPESPGLPASLQKAVPDSLADLRDIEQSVRTIIDQIRQATVGVRLGSAHGSGVIIGDEGYVLTAAHVIGQPGREVELRLNDGRRLKGKSLGVNREIDAGLIQIEDPAGLPSVSMGSMEDVRLGDWCIAIGHPGGFRSDRTPVVRLGRVLLKRSHVIQTDCTLVGGDSGGPLFNLQGKVIGINSRIGRSTSWNFHVPVSAWKGEEWDRLAAGDIIEEEDDNEKENARPEGSVLGINGEDHEEGCRVTEVAKGYPAEAAGLEVGDVITRLNAEEFDSFAEFAAAIRGHRPGTRVQLRVLRDGRELTLTARLAARTSD